MIINNFSVTILSSVKVQEKAEDGSFKQKCKLQRKPKNKDGSV